MITIIVQPTSGRLAEDKDKAKDIRLSTILPALARNEGVVLDFQNVGSATQSYVHALIGEALKRYGDGALEHIEFRHCSPAIQSVVELVVDYSLGGFGEDLPAHKVSHG